MTLVSTLCKLGAKTQSKKPDLLLNTVPKRECHGLFLSVSGATILARLLQKLKIPLHRVYMFTDAISCILSLQKAPSLFKPPFNRYFSEIHCMLLEVGKITGQQNREFIHWIDQRRWPNPADLLSKFCLETDTVESWLSKAEEVLQNPHQSGSLCTQKLWGVPISRFTQSGWTPPWYKRYRHL